MLIYDGKFIEPNVQILEKLELFWYQARRYQWLAIQIQKILKEEKNELAERELEDFYRAQEMMIDSEENAESFLSTIQGKFKALSIFNHKASALSLLNGRNYKAQMPLRIFKIK